MEEVNWAITTIRKYKPYKAAAAERRLLFRRFSPQQCSRNTVSIGRGQVASKDIQKFEMTCKNAVPGTS